MRSLHRRLLVSSVVSFSLDLVSVEECEVYINLYIQVLIETLTSFKPLFSCMSI